MILMAAKCRVFNRKIAMLYNGKESKSISIKYDGSYIKMYRLTKFFSAFYNLNFTSMPPPIIPPQGKERKFTSQICT